ncbi:2-succinyl-6-hydroxy-2,4-cyclohexadiene-1-carboxylate synthase [Alkalibacillus silvisoli]|uniref:Putative 2-succinyl-6-hydroxy-2,4-cyclohexadiene-1-carboxylate synthase n=1 Tax=Alkalibacillus silvisoli TaxID=392823 RepID=A0ABN1A133_9BACI
MYYQINDNQYYVEVHGTGEPLILLHGFTGATTTWNDVLEQYKDKYQVIMIDLPGHGQTKVNQLSGLNQACHDLKELFNQLGLPSINLLGYSMGGRTALLFALLYPEYVKKLILVGASPGLKEEEQMNRQKQDEKLADYIVKEGIETFVDYWQSIPLFETQQQLSARKQKQVRQERMNQSEDGLALSLRTMGTGYQPNLWDHLSKINLPILLIVGHLDSKFVKINKEMEKSLPHAHLEIVNETGHAVHLESPKIFGKIVSRFLDHT